MRAKLRYPKFKIQDSRFKIQDSRFKIQDSRFKIQDSRFKIQDSRFKITSLEQRFSIGKNTNEISNHILFIFIEGNLNSFKQLILICTKIYRLLTPPAGALKASLWLALLVILGVLSEPVFTLLN